MIRRTVMEWKSLRYGDADTEGFIPDWAASRIAAVASASPLGGDGGTRILSHGRKELRAAQVVGVIAADGCALEILPKIDGLGSGDGEDDVSRGRIRRKLVHMLATVLDLEIASGIITDLGWQRENLLEILIGLFARKLADAVRQGIPRRYTEHADDLPALRGRLNVTRQFTTLAASPQRLACRFDALSPDIAINQIMKAAVLRLGRISQNAANQRCLRETAFAYADIQDVAVSALRWDDVVLDRTNARWRELISLARLLLGGRFQTTSSGSGKGFSLLFEMNTLFEEYVARTLAGALRGTDLSVHAQAGRRYCLEEIVDGRAGAQRFQTKPDILVKRDGATALIIDTKWKRLSARIEDPKQGISQADVYQMMAYGRLYKCPRLMLLYPWHAQLGRDPGPTALHRLALDGCDEQLITATTNVAEPRLQLETALRTMIMQCVAAGPQAATAAAEPLPA